MKYESLIFDLDGTLVESGPGIINSIVEAFKKLNVPVPSEEDLRTFVGPPSREVFADYGIPAEQVEEAVTCHRAYYWDKGQYESELYPGIKELLVDLKEQGYRLFVGTSKPEKTAVNMLKYFGIAEYFETIAGATMGSERSTKEQVLRYLLEKEDLKSAVMIGDTIFDVVGANRVGLPCIIVPWGYGEEQEIMKAGALAYAHSMEELTALIS